MAPAPIPVLVNRNGGTAARRGAALADDLAAAFQAAGLSIDLRLIDGGEMADAVRSVTNRPLIAVGGGDGTIGSAAGVLATAGSDTALAILPLGTRNHLARQLGLPPDLPGVARLIAAGTTRRIDLGRVSGRYFVNNASLGLYPQMVRLREAEQARGLPKWLAKVPATWGVLKRLRHHRLRLRLPGHAQLIRTPLLFVGNNRYDLALGRLGERATLEDGVLSVYALGRSSRRDLLALALKTLAGRADPLQDFAAIGDAAKFEVEVRSDRIDLALDGEVVRLAGPLRFEAVPRALRVVAP